MIMNDLKRHSSLYNKLKHRIIYGLNNTQILYVGCIAIVTIETCISLILGRQQTKTSCLFKFLFNILTPMQNFTSCSQDDMTVVNMVKATHSKYGKTDYNVTFSYYAFSITNKRKTHNFSFCQADEVFT